MMHIMKMPARILLGCLMVIVFKSREVNTIPQPQEPNTAGCDDMSVVSCGLPLIAFAMSDLVAERDILQSGGAVKMETVTKLCGLLRPAAECFKGFTTRCLPRNFTEIHGISSGNIRLLNDLCNDPNIAHKAEAIHKCHKTLAGSHAHCDRTPPPDSRNYNSIAESLQEPNKLRKYCCYLKDIEVCYGDKVKTQCGTEAATVNQQFLTKLYTTYGCNAHFSQCRLVAG